MDGSLFLRTFYFTGDKIEQKYIFLFYMSAQNYTRALKSRAKPSFANFAGVIVVSYSTAQNMSRTRYTSMQAQPAAVKKVNVIYKYHRLHERHSHARDVTAAIGDNGLIKTPFLTKERNQLTLQHTRAALH